MNAIKMQTDLEFKRQREASTAEAESLKEKLKKLKGAIDGAKVAADEAMLSEA